MRQAITRPIHTSVFSGSKLPKHRLQDIAMHSYQKLLYCLLHQVCLQISLLKYLKI
jgi:hypothetical protein